MLQLTSCVLMKLNQIAQLYVDGYNFPPFRRDRNNYGGGKIVYIKEGIISKRLNKLEGTNMESICIELTISNIRWCILFIYRPPNNNKNNFFIELHFLLSEIILKYENFMIIGDLNIDTAETSANQGCYRIREIREIRENQGI